MTRFINLYHASFSLYAKSCLVLMALASLQQLAYSQCNTTQVGGMVFRDYNHNGVLDAASTAVIAESGFAGVLIEAITTNGTVVGSATTTATGTWTISGLTASQRVLIKYSMPSGTFSGAIGNQSNSEVDFIPVGTCGLRTGLVLPGDYCQENPNMIGACISDRYQITAPGVFVTNAWDITDNATLYQKKYGETNIGMTLLTNFSQTGNLFGVAYAKKKKLMYGANFIRSGGIKPSSIGKIYVYNPTTNQPAVWADLPALGYSAGSPVDVNVNQNSQFVGYTGLGDLDISNNEDELYVANVFSKKILVLPIAANGALNSAGIKEVTLPTPCTSAATTAVCGLGVHRNGRVYAGVTCIGPGRGDIKITVYSFDPKNANPSSTVQQEYQKTSFAESVTAWANYGPSDWPALKTVDLQLWLTDIVFKLNNDGSEVMYLGTRNRGLDQSIATPGSCNFISPVPIYSANKAAGATTWTNGTATFPSSYGVSGSLAYLDGYKNLVAMYRDCNSNAQDPNSFGGMQLYPTQGGAYVSRFKVLQTAFSEVLMRFNNVWTDIEFACNPAPITIGNLVWYDNDNDGIRDNNEPTVKGVTISLFQDVNGDNLYDAGDLFVSSTTTNVQGQYYFNNVSPDTKYLVLLNDPNNFTQGGPLYNGTLSPANANSNGNDNLDSDATLQSGVPVIAVMTGEPGQNNYTLDFGFSVPGAPVLLPVGCYEIYPPVKTNLAGCLGDPLDPIVIGVGVDAPSNAKVQFVTFPTQQTGTGMYTGGTVLATIDVLNNSATYNIPPPALAGTQYIYAIPSPLPTSTECRPFAELKLVSRDCSVLPDLQLTKSVTPRTAAIGQSVVYTITVKNDGTLGATGVVVRDPLPAGLTLTGNMPSKGTFAAGVWTVGDVAINETATLTLNATVNQAGVFYNTAEITAVNEGDRDSEPNNEDITEDDIGRACVTTPINICPDESYTLSIPSLYSNLQWFKDGMPISGATGTKLVVSEPGLYDVTGSAPNGGTASSCGFDLRLISGIVEPSLTASGASVCTGQSVTLTAANGDTYAWNTGETTPSIMVTPATSATYEVTITQSGCTKTVVKSVGVQVNSAPTVYTFGPTLACTNQELTFNAIGGGTYLWSTGSRRESASVIETTAGNKTYVVTVTNSAGCTATGNVQTTIEANCGPCPTIAIQQPSQTCCYGNLPTSITIDVMDGTIDSVEVSVFYEKASNLATLYDDIKLYSLKKLQVVNNQAIWMPNNAIDAFSGDLADTREIYIYVGQLGAPADVNCRPYAFQTIMVNRKPVCPAIINVVVD